MAVTPRTLRKIGLGLGCSPEQSIGKLIKMYRHGYTLDELAKASNVGINTISGILESAGVPRRNRGEGRHFSIARKVCTLEGLEDKLDTRGILQRLYVEEGLSVKSLARRWDISSNAVRELLWRGGFIIRNCKESAEVRYGNRGPNCIG